MMIDKHLRAIVLLELIKKAKMRKDMTYRTYRNTFCICSASYSEKLHDKIESLDDAIIWLKERYKKLVDEIARG